MDEWIGLHERLWTPALARLIAALGLTERQLRTAAELPAEQAVPMLAAHLARVLQQRLATLSEAEQPAWEQALAALGQSLVVAGPPMADARQPLRARAPARDLRRGQDGGPRRLKPTGGP